MGNYVQREKSNLLLYCLHVNISLKGHSCCPQSGLCYGSYEVFLVRTVKIRSVSNKQSLKWSGDPHILVSTTLCTTPWVLARPIAYFSTVQYSTDSGLSIPFFSFVFETEPHIVSWIVFELRATPLPQSLQCWNYRHFPPCLVTL